MKKSRARLPQRRRVAHATCAFVALAFTTTAYANSFSPVVQWNGAPMHMALTPDGNVLTFGSTAAGEQGGYEMVVWNPKLGVGPASRTVIPNRLAFNSFCTAVTIDPAKGTLLIAGSGTDAANVATGVAEWNYQSRSFSDSYRLKYARYYASSTVLPDGRTHIMGGSLYHGNQINSSPISEVFTPGRGWSELPGTATGPQRRADSAQTGSPMWYPHVFPVRGTEVFAIAGKYTYFENYSGRGSIRDERPFTGSNFGASSGAVMFRPGLVMQMGGGGHFNNVPGDGSRVASIFDLRGVDSQGRTTVTRRDTQMNFGRHWMTPVVLPNGEVLVVGGSRGNNTLEGVANQVEIYNPNSNQWRTGASLTVPRLYHSTAMLMKDGRVAVGGGGAPGPIRGTSLEIYTPAYLANAGGVRPSITSGPNRVALGQNFRITTDRAITRMTLVKVGSVTHSYHMDQRFFEADFRAEAGGYAVTFPNDRINATPGLYMLFAFDSRGVPSEGKFVRLPSPIGDNGWNVPNDTPTSATVPAPVVVPAATGALRPDNALALEPATWPGYKVRHANFLGYISPIGPNNTESEWGTARWIARRGLADPSCTSFESTDWPNYFLRHQGYRVRMALRDGNAQFDGDATFCRRAPLNGNAAGDAMSLEAQNFPGNYIFHRNFELFVGPNDGTPVFAGDASFKPVSTIKPAATGGGSPPPPPTPTTPSSGLHYLEPSTWAGYRVRHANFLGYISPINTGSSALDQRSSLWTVRPGLANAACRSFESLDWPGHFLRHREYRIRMEAGDGSAQFNGDATFCPRAPMNGNTAGGAMSLEAQNFPGNYILHRNFELFVGPNDGSEQFRTDATFRIIGGAAPSTGNNGPSPSPVGASLTPGGGGALLDGGLASWTFGPNERNGNREALRNGVRVGENGGWGRLMRVASNREVWVEANDNTWWAYRGSAWVQQGGAP